MYYKDVVKDWVQENSQHIINGSYPDGMLEDFIDKFDANENLYTVASELYRESSAILRNYCRAPLDFNGNSKLTHLAEFCSLGSYAPKLEPEDFV